MSEEQRLNSLNRFRKKSANFVLEHHSHCEVPAGCGGAILRWRNPLASRFVRIWTYANKDFPQRIDGIQLKSRMLDLSPGKHCFTMEKPVGSSGEPIIMFLLKSEIDESAQHANRVSESNIRIVSSLNGHWRYTTRTPANDDWQLPHFDDSNWNKLEEYQLPQKLVRWEEGTYEHNECAKAGAVILAPPKIWRPDVAYYIRFEFEIPMPTIIAEATDE